MALHAWEQQDPSTQVRGSGLHVVILITPVSLPQFNNKSSKTKRAIRKAITKWEKSEGDFQPGRDSMSGQADHEWRAKCQACGSSLCPNQCGLPRRSA